MSSNAGKQKGQSQPRPIEGQQRGHLDRDSVERGPGKGHESLRRKSTGTKRPPDKSPRSRGSPHSAPNQNKTPPERGRSGNPSNAGPSSRSGSLGRSPHNQGGFGPGQAAFGKSPPVRGTPGRRGSKKPTRLTAEDWDDADDAIRDYFAGHGHQSQGPSRRGRWEQHHEELELEMALAMSLSVNDGAGGSEPRAPGTARTHELSYERLTTLEDVKVTATSGAVAALPSAVFNGSAHSSPMKATTTSAGHEMCTICQHEYGLGDDLVVLPCGHRFHPQCGSEWLLNYSRRCPVCKMDITDDLA